MVVVKLFCSKFLKSILIKNNMIRLLTTSKIGIVIFIIMALVSVSHYRLWAQRKN